MPSRTLLPVDVELDLAPDTLCRHAGWTVVSVSTGPIDDDERALADRLSRSGA